MGKQVQIDESLFDELCDYFFGANAPTGWQADEIRKALNEKLEKLIARELFSKYKRTPTGAEREQARQEYLDFKCIHRDWRTDKELPIEEPPI